MRHLLAALALLVCASAATAQSLDAPPSVVRAALDHLQTRGPALGLSADDLADLAPSSAYVSRDGLAHVYVQQQIGGIEIAEALVSVAVGRDGRVLHAAGDLVAGTASARRAASLSADAALARAAALVGEPTPRAVGRQVDARAERLTTFGRVAQTDVTARLVYVGSDERGLHLAWEVLLPTRDGQHVWQVRLDAATGEELSRHDLVIHESFPRNPSARPSFAPLAGGPAGLVAPMHALAGSYKVYAMPEEAPLWASPAPPADARTIVTNPANATASPLGWHDTGSASYTISRGNNVYAYPDVDNNNSPDGSGVPDGGPGLDFTGFANNLSGAPSTYKEAATTNLFYWNNVIHDVLYQYGFDEAAGNFQTNNFGNGGGSNDAVNAEAQDASLLTGNCNANFFTPTDGNAPRMQMYTCDISSPDSDGDYDNGVIIHEYGHGISIRLTGGPGNSSCLNNAEQMGEGWSDYYGLMLTMEASDSRSTLRPIGNYLIGQGQSGQGIRGAGYQPAPGAPYTTNFGVNSATYGDSNSGLSQPHGIGFVWATILWEVTWDMIDAHGFDPNVYDASGTAGNQIMMALVTKGLALQPCSPGFVDGRDAILAADAMLYEDPANPGQGLHYGTLWQAFARRGLGASASQGSTGSRSDQTEAFDTPLPPPSASVSPGSVSASVAPGASTTASVSLANTAGPGASALTYSASVRNLSQPLTAGGTLPPVASRAGATPSGRLDVRGGKDAKEELGGGTAARLAGGPDAFGYVFVDSDETGGPAPAFQDISGTGAPLTFSSTDDGSTSVGLPFTFPFYGLGRNSVTVSTNGYLSFGSSGTVYTNAPIPGTATPNGIIAPYWDDLHQRSGTAYAGNLPDGRFAIQWTHWGRYSPSSGQDLTFQVILSEDGTIEYQYGTISTTVTTSATVGIENDGGDTGLQVVYNSSYIESNKAVRFTQPLLWVSAAPANGSIAPGASEDLTLTFDATDLPEGTYTADLVLASNDPASPSVTVPLTLTVEEGGTGTGPIVFTAPAAEEALTAGTTYLVTWDPGAVSPSVTMKLNLKSPTEGNSTLANNVPNTGAFSWDIPSVQGTATDYRIVGVYTDPATGNKVRPKTGQFEISGGVAPPTPITVTAPSGGTVWTAGTTQAITWDMGDIPGSVTLQVRLLGDGTNVRQERNVDNDGSWDWDIPAGQAAGDYKIMLVYTDPTTGQKVKPKSDLFEIEAPPSPLASSKSGGPELALQSVIPNPARGRAEVAFSLADAGTVRLSVHDVRGREVALLEDGHLEAGAHRALWTAEALAPGVYVVRLQAGAALLTQRAVVVR